MKIFSAEYLNGLTVQAQASLRKRQHRNIHESYEALCQRTFNAIEPDSYLRPHQHAVTQGPETMVGIRGLMALIVFDDGGQILLVQRFGAGGAVTDPTIAAGTESPPGIWHSVVSLEPGSILLEVKSGPYDLDAPRYPAPWAPEEDRKKAKPTWPIFMR